MRIKVTKYDIGTGTRNNCFQCPIALSLKAKGFKDAQVLYSYIKINNKLIEPPIEVRSFMLAFDTGERVHPFEFDLNY